MKRLPLWWVPLLLLLAPAAGWIPQHRDLADYFLPMFEASLEMGDSMTATWISFRNGCGEAWFANPQTRVLSPLRVVLGPQHSGWFLTLEVASGLALFSLGCGLLARRWGAGRWGVSLSEFMGWSSGPLLSSVGILTNLSTLAWIPWMFLAAGQKGHRAVALTAIVTAAAWLGGEPQLWLLGVVLMVVTAPSKLNAAAGALLGALLCSAQIVPFARWVAEGDRGAGAASWTLPGALTWHDLLGFLAPLRLSGTEGTIYVESLVIGVPATCCVLLGLRRRLALGVAAVVLVGVALLPGSGLGSLYLMLTQGMVRFPSRFALLAGAVLVPVAGVGVRPWLAGRGRWLAVALGVTGLAATALVDEPLPRALAAIAAGLTLATALPSATRSLRMAALVVGMSPLASTIPGLLELRTPPPRAPEAAPWPEARDGGRVYATQPTRSDLQHLPPGLDFRRLRLMGYASLLDGMISVRSPAPVVNSRLVDHLDRIDTGPAGRWWLDTLAVRWVVLPEDAPHSRDMRPVATRGGFTLHRNLRASGLVRLSAGPPDPDSAITPMGGVVTLRSRQGRLVIRTLSSRSGSAWLAVSPVADWLWRLDGVSVRPRPGPGVLQVIPLSPGPHVLEASYRPPGVVFGGILSAVAAVVLVVVVGAGLRAGASRPRGRFAGGGEQGVRAGTGAQRERQRIETDEGCGDPGRAGTAPSGEEHRQVRGVRGNPPAVRTGPRCVAGTRAGLVG